MQAVLRYLLGGLAAPPPLGRALGTTLSGLVLAALNMAGEQEVWPHTPGAALVLPLATGLLALAALPQLAWWAGRWLWACTGPRWLLPLLQLVFIACLLPLGLLWLLGSWLWLDALGSSW